MKLSELKIDPEFESNNPKLSEAEKEQLKKNLLTDGVTISPLIVWGTTIVDGHNRYRILLEHPEIEYSIKQMEFDNRHQAIAWICKNQLGRRNLTPEQRKYLIGKQYEAEKAAHGAIDGFRGNRHTKELVSDKNCHLLESNESNSTRERLAKEHNISSSSVENCYEYFKGVDAAEKVEPGIKNKLLSGELQLTQKKVAAVAKAEPEKRKQLVEDLQKPKEKPPKPEKKVSEKMQHIVAISEGMTHSEGINSNTVDDMHCEMEDALSSFIWRWENCRETYPKIITSEEGKKVIRELVKDGMEFLEKVSKGELWNEK